MDHTEVADLITSFLDGELPDETRGLVARHLETCADCRAELAAQREVKVWLAAVPLVDPPRNFTLPRTAGLRPVPWLPRVRSIAAAAAVVLFLLIGADVLTPAPRQPIVSSIQVAVPSDPTAGFPQSQAAPVVAGARAERADPESTDPAAPGRGNSPLAQRDLLRLAEVVALVTLIGAGGAWLIGTRRLRGAEGGPGAPR